MLVSICVHVHLCMLESAYNVTAVTMIAHIEGHCSHAHDLQELTVHHVQLYDTESAAKNYLSEFGNSIKILQWAYHQWYFASEKWLFYLLFSYGRSNFNFISVSVYNYKFTWITVYLNFNFSLQNMLLIDSSQFCHTWPNFNATSAALYMFNDEICHSADK